MEHIRICFRLKKFPEYVLEKGTFFNKFRYLQEDKAERIWTSQVIYFVLQQQQHISVYSICSRILHTNTSSLSLSLSLSLFGAFYCKNILNVNKPRSRD